MIIMILFFAHVKSTIGASGVMSHPICPFIFIETFKIYIMKGFSNMQSCANLPFPKTPYFAGCPHALSNF